MMEFQQNGPRMVPAMGGMFRQQMFPPMYPVLQMPPSMYPYMRQPMFPRQPQYPRPFHRQNQPRRAGKQNQPQMQQPQQAQMPVQMPAQPQPQPIPQPVPAAVRPVEAPAETVDKQQIGEQIYTRIMQMYEDNSLWGKLTGMLLESIPLPELQTLLANPAALNEKITQAKDYYDKHMFELGGNQ